MSLIELKLKDKEDYQQALRMLGEIRERRGWKPDPELETMLFVNGEYAQELKNILADKGIEFEDVSRGK